MMLRRVCCLTAGLFMALAGCKSAQTILPIAGSKPAPGAAAISASAGPGLVPAGGASSTITQVAYQEPLPQPTPAPSQLPPADVVEGVISREWLQAEIEARNPSLEAMVAAWQAAAEVYPQRVALDDPILMGMLAPQSVASNTTETAYAFQLNQKLPWHGKRELRGAVAAADADAAYQDAEDTRLRVRLAADLAFFEYFLVTRLLELNGENTRLMVEFRETAQTKYRANLVTQQDILQADLELADLARRQLELARMRQVSVARINTLLRRWPDAPLPPPPARLDSPAPPEDKDAAWQLALRQRPDLAALAWRVQAAEAELQLAYKNYYPDFDTFARYDTFWQPASTQGPLRTQIGVAMNLPVYRHKLQAALCQAQFRLNQRRAEFDQQALEIQYEVLAAVEQVEESRKAVELFSERLIPVAEQNIDAARSNYTVGKLSFLELAQAQRQVIGIREREVEALVAYHRRMAELARAVAGPVPRGP